MKKVHSSVAWILLGPCVKCLGSWEEADWRGGVREGLAEEQGLGGSRRVCWVPELGGWGE